MTKQGTGSKPEPKPVVHFVPSPRDWATLENLSRRWGVPLNTVARQLLHVGIARNPELMEREGREALDETRNVPDEPPTDESAE